MLRSRDFWIGILLGIAIYYLYTTKFKKGNGGS
jgi:hypothetical protein